MEELEAIRYDVDESNWGKYGILGTPLLDLLSVSIKPNTTSLDDTQKPLEIYGTIEAITGNSDRYMLFDQPYDSPQIISQFDSNDSIFLYIFDDGPFFSFFPLVKIQVNLMDRVRNIELVKRRFVLVNYKHFLDYDIIQYQDVDGDMASLCFKYISYRAAVWAAIELIPTTKNGASDSQESGQVTISGTIFASCLYDGNDFSVHSHSERGCTCVPLLLPPNENDSVGASLGEAIELYRSILAVPSYSHLIIETNFEATDGQVVSDVVSFSSRAVGIDDKSVKGPNGLVFTVQVTWYHKYPNHMECEVVEGASDHENENESSDVEQEKKAKVFETQASRTCLYDEPLPLEFIGEDLTEIFSIFIGLDKGNPSHIHGEIVVLDSYYIYHIYDKDQSLSEKFECNKTLSLLGLPTCLAGSQMTIITDLKDNGRELCKGFFAWHDGNRRAPFLNRRLCSVIKGKLGYAAVHHAIFSSAIQGSVKVYLSPTSPCDHICISGRLMGEYSDHEYSTFFEREYYRSVLFTRSDGNPLMVPFKGHESAIPISSSRVSSDVKGIPVPLSKSVVCVPTDSSLRIEVNLSLMSESPKVEAQALSGNVEFQIGRNTCWKIQSQAYQLYMLVEWSNLHIPPRKKISR